MHDLFLIDAFSRGYKKACTKIDQLCLNFTITLNYPPLYFDFFKFYKIIESK